MIQYITIGASVHRLPLTKQRVKSKFNNYLHSDVSHPFIVYRRTSIEPSDSKDRFIYSEDTYVEVVIASDKYNESIEIADLVKNALQGKKGNYSGINIHDIRMTNADEDYIEDTFIQNLTFNIKTNGRTSN